MAVWATEDLEPGDEVLSTSLYVSTIYVSIIYVSFIYYLLSIIYPGALQQRLQSVADCRHTRGGDCGGQNRI